MISIEDFSKVEMRVGTVVSAEEVEGSEKLIKLQVDLGPWGSGGSFLSSHPELVSGSQMLKQAFEAVSPQAESVQHDNKRDIRQVLAGIKQWYKPEDLVGKQVVIVANLEPRKLMGKESQGMLLVADTEDKPILLTSSETVPPGTKVC